MQYLEQVRKKDKERKMRTEMKAFLLKENVWNLQVTTQNRNHLPARLLSPY